MIRTTITAHIPTVSLKELTFQINDRSLGGLALQRQQNYVMTGNRRVQMVTGIITDRKRKNAIAEDKYQLRKWESCFRELQTSGLSVFSSVADRENLRCDFLILIDETRFVCYTTPRVGIYLNRSGRLFRVQPIDMPSDAPLFFGLDMYSFEVQMGDSILALAPEFIDLFDANELIETFLALRQVSTVMAKLSDLAETYGEGLVKPWLAFQIQRTQEEQQSAAGLPVKSSKRFPANLARSKVVRLENGNILIPVKAPPPELVKQKTGKIHLIEPEPTQIQLEKKNPFYPSGRRTLAASERDTTRLDRLKTKDAKSLGRQGGSVLKRLMNMFPGQKLLSRTVFYVLVTLLLVLVILAGKAIMSNMNAADTRPIESLVVVDPENSAKLETLRTDFEIEWEVKANSLTVYSEAGEGRLLGTVMRGEKVWKLSEPIDDWVLVRLEDGRTGFVYAPMVGN